MRAAIMTHTSRETLAVALQARISRYVPDATLQIQQQPPERKYQHRNTIATWRKGLGDPDGLIFMEDDIELAHPGFFQELLPELKHEAELVCLCLVQDRNLPGRLKAAAATLGRHGEYKVPGQIVNMREARRWGGSQCVFIPAALLEPLIAFGETQSESVPSDGMMQRFVTQERRGQMRLAIPSPFDHRDEPSLIDKRRRFPLKSTASRFVPYAWEGNA